VRIVQAAHDGLFQTVHRGALTPTSSARVTMIARCGPAGGAGRLIIGSAWKARIASSSARQKTTVASVMGHGGHTMCRPARQARRVKSMACRSRAAAPADLGQPAADRRRCGIDHGGEAVA
jgi:hypothetical protein